MSPQARADWFAEFWSAYPKRTGTNPKQPAQERFLRLLKADPEPEALARSIIEGAKRFAASVLGEDPRFTMQAKRWLNEGCWKDDHWPASARRSSSAREGPERHGMGNLLDAMGEPIAEVEQPRDPFIRAGGKYFRDRPDQGVASAAVGIAAVLNRQRGAT